MLIKDKSNISLALLCSIFIVIIPIATILNYFDNPEISKIILILILNCLAIQIFLIFSVDSITYVEKRLEFSGMRLGILSLIFLIPLIYFVSQKIEGYDLVQIAFFSGRYRQGEFSGSGIYTSWSTQVLPIIIFLILINNGFSKSLIIPLFVVIFASAILGLRVYLWTIFIGFFFILTKKFNIRFMIVGAAFVSSFFLYKLLLNVEYDKNIYELFVGQLLRPDLHVIVKNREFSDSLIDIFQFFPFIRNYFGHDYSAFKEFYVPLIPNLSQQMPFVSLYSGVALPGYVMFYNVLYIFSLIPSVLLLIILHRMMVNIKKKKSLFYKILNAYLFGIISLAFLEDVNVLYKLENEFVLFFLALFSYKFIDKFNTSENWKLKK